MDLLINKETECRYSSEVETCSSLQLDKLMKSRTYSSQFILNDDIFVAVERREYHQPFEDMVTIEVDICVGLFDNGQTTMHYSMVRLNDLVDEDTWVLRMINYDRFVDKDILASIREDAMDHNKVYLLKHRLKGKSDNCIRNQFPFKKELRATGSQFNPPFDNQLSERNRPINSFDEANKVYISINENNFPKNETVYTSHIDIDLIYPVNFINGKLNNIKVTNKVIEPLKYVEQEKDISSKKEVVEFSCSPLAVDDSINSLDDDEDDNNKTFNMTLEGLMVHEPIEQSLSFPREDTNELESFDNNSHISDDNRSMCDSVSINGYYEGGITLANRPKIIASFEEFNDDLSDDENLSQKDVCDGSNIIEEKEQKKLNLMFDESICIEDVICQENMVLQNNSSSLSSQYIVDDALCKEDIVPEFFLPISVEILQDNFIDPFMPNLVMSSGSKHDLKLITSDNYTDIVEVERLMKEGNDISKRKDSEQSVKSPENSVKEDKKDQISELESTPDSMYEASYNVDNVILKVLTKTPIENTNKNFENFLEERSRRMSTGHVYSLPASRGSQQSLNLSDDSSSTTNDCRKPLAIDRLEDFAVNNDQRFKLTNKRLISGFKKECKASSLKDVNSPRSLSFSDSNQKNETGKEDLFFFSNHLPKSQTQNILRHGDSIEDIEEMLMQQYPIDRQEKLMKPKGFKTINIDHYSDSSSDLENKNLKNKYVDRREKFDTSLDFNNEYGSKSFISRKDFHSKHSSTCSNTLSISSDDEFKMLEIKLAENEKKRNNEKEMTLSEEQKSQKVVEELIDTQYLSGKNNLQNAFETDRFEELVDPNLLKIYVDERKINSSKYPGSQNSSTSETLASSSSDTEPNCLEKRPPKNKNEMKKLNEKNMVEEKETISEHSDRSSYGFSTSTNEGHMEKFSDPKSFKIYVDETKANSCKYPDSQNAFTSETLTSSSSDTESNSLEKKSKKYKNEIKDLNEENMIQGKETLSQHSETSSYSSSTSTDEERNVNPKVPNIFEDKLKNKISNQHTPTDSSSTYNSTEEESYDFDKKSTNKEEKGKFPNVNHKDTIPQNSHIKRSSSSTSIDLDSESLSDISKEKLVDPKVPTKYEYKNKINGKNQKDFQNANNSDSSTSISSDEDSKSLRNKSPDHIETIVDQKVFKISEYEKKINPSSSQNSEGSSTTISSSSEEEPNDLNKKSKNYKKEYGNPNKKNGIKDHIFSKDMKKIHSSPLLEEGEDHNKENRKYNTMPINRNPQNILIKEKCKSLEKPLSLESDDFSDMENGVPVTKTLEKKFHEYTETWSRQSPIENKHINRNSKPKQRKKVVKRTYNIPSIKFVGPLTTRPRPVPSYLSPINAHPYEPSNTESESNTSNDSDYKVNKVKTQRTSSKNSIKKSYSNNLSTVPPLRKDISSKVFSNIVPKNKIYNDDNVDSDQNKVIRRVSSSSVTTVSSFVDHPILSEKQLKGNLVRLDSVLSYSISSNTDQSSNSSKQSSKSKKSVKSESSYSLSTSISYSDSDSQPETDQFKAQETKKVHRVTNSERQNNENLNQSKSNNISQLNIISASESSETLSSSDEEFSSSK